VTLVCADPKRHRLERLLSMRADAGLTQVLQGTVPLNKATVPTAVGNLILLPCGRETDRPTELFQSDAMRTTLESLATGSDFVLVDGPPLGDADAVALLPFVDAVLFVMDARRMRARTFRLARRQLDRAEAPIVGLVFNRVTRSVLEPDVHSVPADVASA
jgi:Mrp family chromosome partitioning ATPase